MAISERKAGEGSLLVASSLLLVVNIDGPIAQVGAPLLPPHRNCVSLCRATFLDG